MVKKGWWLLLIVAIGFANHAVAAPVAVTPAAPLTLEKLLLLSPKAFEKATGKHLSFKEKLGYRLLQWKLRKQLRQHKDETGDKAMRRSKNALFYGIATWVILFLGLAVPVVGLLSIPTAIAAIIEGALSLNKTPSNTRSILGIVLGGLYLALFLIALFTFVS